VITVQVGSQVSGSISKLYVDFNSHVRKGQLIAQIDPALFEGALAQAKVDLENARANLAVAVANTAKAKAGEVQMRADYERNLGLGKQGIVSQQTLDVAKANAESATAQVNGAVAQSSRRMPSFSRMKRPCTWRRRILITQRSPRLLIAL
jgi:HlyD family secretion protein